MESLEVEKSLQGPMNLIPTEEVKLQEDFCVCLEKFGIDPKYIQKFRNDNEQVDKGWDWGNTDPLIIAQEQEEASAFARCVELEELSEATTDVDLKKQYEWEIEELREKLIFLQRRKSSKK